MLKHYDQLDEMFGLENFHQNSRVKLTHSASELMEQLGYKDEKDLNDALLRTFEVCTVMKISIRENFHKIYRYQNGSLLVDWQLSDLASYLLMINGNPCNPNVAKAQLYMLLHSEIEK